MTSENTRSNSSKGVLEKFRDMENDRIIYDYDGQSISIQ